MELDSHVVRWTVFCFSCSQQLVLWTLSLWFCSSQLLKEQVGQSCNERSRPLLMMWRRSCLLLQGTRPYHSANHSDPLQPFSQPFRPALTIQPTIQTRPYHSANHSDPLLSLSQPFRPAPITEPTIQTRPYHSANHSDPPLSFSQPFRPAPTINTVVLDTRWITNLGRCSIFSIFLHHTCGYKTATHGVATYG